MSNVVPKTIYDRISQGLKKYQKILANAVDRDINESDTVIIISDILQDIFGFDKHCEVTAEYEIKGGFCDLAVKIDDKPFYVIEAKAIGIKLKDQHLRQALGYATTDGVEWIVLTNGVVWKAHHVSFEKPITTEEIFEIDMLEANHRDKKIIEHLYLLSKEGITKTALSVYHDTLQATNKFTVATLLLSETFIKSLCREIKKMNKNVKILPEDIETTLKNDVIKRDAMDPEKMKQIQRQLKRTSK